MAPAPKPAAPDGRVVATLVTRGEPARASAAVNVPIRLQRGPGESIGFVRQGAPILQWVDQGQQLQIVVDFPAVPAAGVLRGRPPRERASPLLFVQPGELKVWLDARLALASAPVELAVRAPKPEDVFYGLYREMSLVPNGLGFAFVRCGRAVVLERRGTSMRVATEHDSGELYGWIDAAAPGQRDEACEDPRSPPRGYESASLRSTAFRWLADRKASFFVKVGQSPASCEEWQFSDEGGSKHLARPGTTTGSRRVERDYWLAGALLGVGGGSIQTSPSAGLGFGAVDGYAVVDAGQTALQVIDVGRPDPDDEAPVVAYRASAVEQWFLTREACDASSQVAVPPRAAESRLRSRFR